MPSTEEEPKLEKLIQLAYAMTHIKKPGLQRFMVFAIHCAADYLKNQVPRGQDALRYARSKNHLSDNS